jgi:hypothetical protein
MCKVRTIKNYLPHRKIQTQLADFRVLLNAYHKFRSVWHFGGGFCCTGKYSSPDRRGYLPAVLTKAALGQWQAVSANHATD